MSMSVKNPNGPLNRRGVKQKLPEEYQEISMRYWNCRNLSNDLKKAILFHNQPAVVCITEPGQNLRKVHGYDIYQNRNTEEKINRVAIMTTRVTFIGSAKRQHITNRVMRKKLNGTRMMHDVYTIDRSHS